MTYILGVMAYTLLFLSLLVFGHIFVSQGPGDSSCVVSSNGGSFRAVGTQAQCSGAVAAAVSSAMVILLAVGLASLLSSPL